MPLIEDMRAYGRQWLGADCADVPEAGASREPVAAAV